MCLKIRAAAYLNEIKEKWLVIQNTSNVFAYKLHIKNSKFLEEKKIIYVEYNPERMRLRRLPQTITRMRPPFDENQFNFKKINPLERLHIIPYEDSVDISLIINKSPLTKYHTLICPDVAAGQPQYLTVVALKFCLTFLFGLPRDQKAFRIGYNSPGALASVNHLHLHLVHIIPDLYIDKADLQSLQEPNIFRLSQNMPTEAICFTFKNEDDNEIFKLKLKRLYNFIEWLCDHDIPHNLFMTPNRSDSHEDMLKVFVYARQHFCYIKDFNTYNIGFCELSGYVTVGDEHLYECLTDHQVFGKIKEETGNVYKQQIYDYFT